MSAITDYASLLVDVGEYSGRDDIAHLFPRFVALAEAKFNRVLRVGEMEASASVLLTNGNGNLPADFLEARMIVSPAGRNLSAWSLSELNRRYANYGGLAAGYAVVGKVLRVRPVADGSVAVDYYAAVPPLTPTNYTNWLLEKAPDAYLYGVAEEVAIWERDPAKTAAAQGLKVQALKGLALQDERSRWGDGQVVIGGITP